MTVMWPLPVDGKLLEVAARGAQLTGFVSDAARDGLPAHELGRGLWQSLLQLGQELQATYFALAGDGDCGETAPLADGRVVQRWPERHGRPYRALFGAFTLERVVYGTREGQRIEAVPLDARPGLPEGKCSYLLRDWNQALVVEAPFDRVNAMRERMLGLQPSVASLETMTRTLAGAVAGAEATRLAAAPAPGAQIVVLSADGQGVPRRKPADAPAIAAHDPARGAKPDRKKMAVLGAVCQSEPHVRTPLAVVEARLRDPAAPGPADRTEPRRPVPPEKRGCAGLPVAAAVAEALAPPRPVEVIFPWGQAEARRRDPDHQQPWVLLLDGQPSLWEAAAATLGKAPRVEILDLLHATGSRSVPRRRLPHRLRRERRGLPPRRQGPDGPSREAPDSPRRPSPVEPPLRGPQQRVGAIHEPLHPTRNRAPLGEPPDPALIHPASPRGLNQGRARRVTPDCYPCRQTLVFRYPMQTVTYFKWRLVTRVSGLGFDDEDKRRGNLLQINRGEGRHSLARAVFHGKRGELRQRYRERQEDQLGALGLVLNMIALRNTIYLEAALDQLRKEGYPVKDEDVARLSPLIHHHIHMLGRYFFSMPEAVARGELRPLRDPANDPE